MKHTVAYSYYGVTFFLLCLCTLSFLTHASGRGRGAAGFFAGLGIGTVIGATAYPAPYYVYNPYYPYLDYPRYGRYYPYDAYYDGYADGRHSYYPDRPKN